MLPITHHILPLRTGWDPCPATASFYPEDLPAAWRLTYFANEVRRVLVPAARWLPFDPERIAQWARDVPSDFRFFLELPECTAPSMPCQVEDLLKERLGGWVGADLAVSGAHAGRAPRFVRVDTLAAARATPAHALACPAPTGDTWDPRAARAWLTRLATAANGRHTLALLGQAPVETVLRWQTLTELLGLA